VGDMARLSRAESGVMGDEGQRIKQRRERLDMGKQELAKLAGVSRDTLAAIEGGPGFRRSSLTKIERALDQLEEEAGMEAPPPVSAEAEQQDLVEFRVEGVMGAQAIVVKGPVKDVQLFEQSIARILKQLRGEADESD
jgi:DNA-binding XRE family transcriptional regulator